jgi:hypothetical protein
VTEEVSSIDIALSFAALLPMLAANFFASRLASIAPDRRSRLRSFAGGLAAAYVFLLVLPKLADQQSVLKRAFSNSPITEYLYHHAYLVALAGFVAYYLVNVLTRSANTSVPCNIRGAVLVLGLGLYSGVIGEMIAAQEPRQFALALFSIALTLHLLGLNLSLHGYLSRSWHWLSPLLAACLCLGWLIGVASPIPPLVHALVSAWLAGGVIILVVLIELPEERRPGAFVAGAVAFSVLIKLNLYLTGA